MAELRIDGEQGSSDADVEECRDVLLRHWPSSWTPLDDLALQRLSSYYRHLLQWNVRLNLTRLSAPFEMAIQNILDSAQALPYLRDDGDGLLDVGSGAGFPGLVLAILRPTLPVLLLDARAKRVEFLAYVIRSLGLPCVQARHGHWPMAFDKEAGLRTLLSRATFPEIDSFLASGRMPAPLERMILWRGDVRADSVGRHVSYTLPGMHRARHLLIVE